MKIMFSAGFVAKVVMFGALMTALAGVLLVR